MAKLGKDYGARVGVWLMPDNRKTGALEDFLQDLINESSPLFTHAKDSAREAKRFYHECCGYRSNPPQKKRMATLKFSNLLYPLPTVLTS